ncbi:MAG: hypothetical protein STSR0008_24070 [Ignavibacterium sp.]
MNRNRQLDLADKYIVPIIWFNNVLANNLFDGNVLMEEIKSNFLNLTNCSSEKFNQLRKKEFIDFDYQPEDEPLIETFWQIVNNIREANL